MPGWTPQANWMAFPHLDDGAGLTCAFTLAYKITDDSSEHWTSRFNRFKDKNRDQLAGAISVMRIAVPELLAALELDIAQTISVPALSSGETTASEKGFIPVLTRLTAEAAGAHFVLNAVSKKAHRPIHGIYSASDRTAELDKAEYVGTRLNGKNVLIFDDFITRGGTMSRIAQALIAVNPGLRVYGVALAKTERRAYWGNLDNNHVPQRWDGLRQAGEKRYLAKKAGENV